MRGYVFKPEDLYYTVDGYSTLGTPQYLWPANPGSPPTGAGVINGVAYLSDFSAPALIVDSKNRARIVRRVAIQDAEEARVIVGGHPLLVEDGQVLFDHDSGKAERTIMGLRRDGSLVHFALRSATRRAAGLVAVALGCVDALQITQGVQPPQQRAGVGAVTATALPAKVWVCDPGHGGSDPGAVGHGMYEKTLNLQAAKNVMRRLEDYEDVLVLPTRTTDVYVSLTDRSELSNAADADLFISLHSNAYHSTARGYEDFIFVRPTAGCIQVQNLMRDNIAPVLKAYGIPNRGHKKENFHVIRETLAPALLTEWLFLTNPTDAELLRNEDAWNLYCDAVAKTVVGYLGLKERKKPQPPPPDKLYRVQVGAFRELANANALVERLRKQGYTDAFIVG